MGSRRSPRPSAKPDIYLIHDTAAYVKDIPGRRRVLVSPSTVQFAAASGKSVGAAYTGGPWFVVTYLRLRRNIAKAPRASIARHVGSGTATTCPLTEPPCPNTP